MTEEKNRYKDDTDALLYVLSHDLRGPARALRQYATLLEKELVNTESNERMERFIARFQQVLDGLDAQLDGLLALSRIKKSTASPVAVDLEDIVQTALNTRNLRGTVSSDLPTVWAEPMRVTRLIDELLDNVVHHAGDTAAVSVSFESNEFILADNGAGMEVHILEQAMTVFRPIAPHGSDRRGLGLNLCQRIISSLGGTFRIESSISQGTRIHFKLPIQSDD